MALSLKSYCLQGLEVLPVSVEIDLARGMPKFVLIGMVSTSVREAADRVRSAIVQSGFTFPMNRKVVNLAPAGWNKKGTHFDLAIAVGLLVASEQIDDIGSDVLLVGELGLEGGVRAVPGVVSVLQWAVAAGFKSVILPAANLAEASVVEGVDLIPVKSLREVVGHFDERPLEPQRLSFEWGDEEILFDLGDVSGHAAAKRALLIAAAGGHHLMMSGPPGTGKSLLARAFPSLLPPLSKEEHLEVLRVYSVARQRRAPQSLARPFRNVHHSVTPTALIGGGPNLMPGELSLAHHGVLFMDEFVEFSRQCLEMLRVPLEEGSVSLSRGTRQHVYPCQFQLVAALNPPEPEATAAQLARFQSKLSGPIMDRIDLRIEVPRLDFGELNAMGDKGSLELREVVKEARRRQRKRGLNSNQEMNAKQVKNEPLSRESASLLEEATRRYQLSGRGVHRVIKVARTIADLEARPRVESGHILEALQYRIN